MEMQTSIRQLCINAVTARNTKESNHCLIVSNTDIVYSYKIVFILNTSQHMATQHTSNHGKPHINNREEKREDREDRG